MSSQSTSVAYFFITFLFLWSFSFRIFVLCGSFEIWIIRTTTTTIINISSSSLTMTTITNSSTKSHNIRFFREWCFSSWSEFMFFINNSLFCSATRRHFLPLPQLWPRSRPRPRLKFTTFTSGNDVFPVGQNSWFLSTISYFVRQQEDMKWVQNIL